ncbi:MAG: flagella basal body P-ring formation protein FlgA [Lysobacterales bacterium RIFOXYD1_FULL_69_11]|nr:MAG: flagella basal body P-ring formation protein FlgA [Xanthomonadales bacterium RIFOXYA1_FULL_69_10]OHE87282.1 MAG: flagella basal body P-ring formation protein FlgA [Xanthomonadales bacterium RIFOXYD1_FULL_69_11]
MGASAHAADFTPPDTIRDAALAAVGADSSTAEATVDSRLRMAACTQPLQALPVSRRSVQVRCADAPGWQMFVPVRVRDVREVAVLRDSVKAGQTITADDVTLQRRDMAGAQGPGFADPADLVGQVARRGFASGDALTRDDVAAGELLRRGDPVVLLSRIGGVEVRVAGRVLGQPGVGGTVSVENIASRRVVRGRVVEAGVVEVR